MNTYIILDLLFQHCLRQSQMFYFLYCGNYPTSLECRETKNRTPLLMLSFMYIYLNIKLKGIALVYLTEVFPVVLYYIP